MIARRSGGSFRDAESLLDQLAAYSAVGITPDLISAILGSASPATVMRVVRSLETGDVSEGLRAVSEAVDQGADPRQFLEDVIDRLRSLLLLRLGGDEHVQHLDPEVVAELRGMNQGERLPTGQLLRAIRLLCDAAPGLRHAVQPQLPIELAIVEALLVPEARSPRAVSDPGREAAVPARMPPPEAIGLPSPSPTQIAPGGDAAPPTTAPVSGESAATAVASGTEPGQRQGADGDHTAALELGRVQAIWNAVVSRMSTRDRQVQALLRDAHPTAVEGNVVTLLCRWPLHREQLSKAERLAMVESVLSEVLSAPCHVQYLAQSEAPSGESATADTRREIGSTVAATPQAPAVDEEEIRRALLNHPAVRDLERRGGKVSRVDVFGADPPKEKDGR
jgi:DNA polymerase-3 subunit gamma/tau